MRLCRFQTDDLTLVGFFENGRVIPIQGALESYVDETGMDLWIEPSPDLLDYLPPDGASLGAIRTLHDWVVEKEKSDGAGLGIPHDRIRLLAPIQAPPKILLLAGNYAAHVVERGGTPAERRLTFPYVFMKPATTINHPGDPIRIPRVSPDHIDWECELAVIIGRRCRGVAEAEAMDYVAGYTIINDISDRKFTPNPDRKPRERDKFFDWLHGKWHDTFLPMGPCVVPSDYLGDPQDLKLTLTVNGEVKQAASTGQMIFPIAAIIEFVSRFVTLEPGDLIATGTPAGVGSATETYLEPGDVVEATISGIGTLKNTVEAEE
ncbi:fumarylacetoacetate hydrolase family protein [Tundrisphaera sp. TA3]|uniref:fumarylacetoacetate hydrolase family protein n=1 Tax=Tundrisphaera sp. TA3 TaxID=3435775 RepID=UPI003EBF57D7